jgi:cyclophilin family peptidyl-prolyl cis-trans isomerase
MRRVWLGAAMAVALIGWGGVALAQQQAAGATPAKIDRPLVTFETSMGKIVVKLYPDKAPETVKNFLQYVQDGFFNGTIFHRVVPSFVIQGGGYTEQMARKETRPPIVNEAARGLKNAKYTISMARTNDPNSATSQFFISLKDNTASLDPNPASEATKWGYCAFGEVVEGQAVVDAIGAVKTEIRAGMKDVPAVPVVLVKASVGTPQTPPAGK